MNRLVIGAALVGVAALVLPTALLAKGASQAVITGPGLSSNIRLAGEGSPDGGTLMRLAESAGFFPAAFRTTPNPMLTKRPDVALGPRYRIVYTMPGPNGEVSKLRQALYPYATPRPVTYMKPGQAFFGTEQTVGGWFVAKAKLKRQLVALGLPKTAPRGSAIP